MNITEINNEIRRLQIEKKRLQDAADIGDERYIKSLEWLKGCDGSYSHNVTPYGGYPYVIYLTGDIPRSSSIITIEGGVYCYLNENKTSFINYQSFPDRSISFYSKNDMLNFLRKYKLNRVTINEEEYNIMSDIKKLYP